MLSYFSVTSVAKPIDFIGSNVMKFFLFFFRYEKGLKNRKFKKKIVNCQIRYVSQSSLLPKLKKVKK